MTQPVKQKTWTISSNNRISYVSLNDTMARLLYGLKNFLVATMGYTVKYTCDGTTGPSSSSDHTDRWTSFSNCTTRFNGTGGAQSFCVLTDGNGVDILLAYQGSTDDRAVMSMSINGVYTPAGTATNAPTATDETPLTSTSSFIASTTSNDRVFHIWASSDKKIFRCAVYRLSTMACWFGVEVCSSAVTGVSWPAPVVGFWTSQSTPTSATNGHVLILGAVGQGGQTRISSTTVTADGGSEIFCASASSACFTPPNPELQAAAAITNCSWSSNTTNFTGKLGDRYDVWFYWYNGIAQGDVVGSPPAFAMFGTGLQPWNNGPVVIS